MSGAGRKLAGSCCSVGADESRGKREGSWGAEGFRESGITAVSSEFQLSMSSWNLEEHHDAIQRSSSPRTTEAGAVQPGIPTCISTSADGSMSIAFSQPSTSSPRLEFTRRRSSGSPRAHARALRNPESAAGANWTRSPGHSPSLLAHGRCIKEWITPRRSNRPGLSFPGGAWCATCGGDGRVLKDVAGTYLAGLQSSYGTDSAMGGD